MELAYWWPYLIPHHFFSRVLEAEQGVQLPEAGKFAVGQIFMPADATEHAQVKEIMERYALIHLQYLHA